MLPFFIIVIILSIFFAVDSVDGDCYDSRWCRRSAECTLYNDDIALVL